MRIAALSPQFIVEMPENLDGDAQRILRATGERTFRAQPAAPSQRATGESLDDATRSAVRRLSKLIRSGTLDQERANADADPDRERESSHRRESHDDLDREGESTPHRPRASQRGSFSHISNVYLTREGRAFAAYRETANRETMWEASAGVLRGQLLNVVC